jgi:Asp/Glu/hydantoin racemase
VLVDRSGGECVRQLFDFPVLRIDEAMAERAIHTGSRVGVIATLSTTLDPTVNLIRDTAARLGRPVEVASHLCEGAFQAVISGDTATHDRAVTEGLKKLAGEVDVIVLAQASMARVVDQLPAGELPVPVLSSPRLAMERARDVLAG